MRVRSIIATVQRTVRRRALAALHSEHVAAVFGGCTDGTIPCKGEALLRWVARMENAAYGDVCRFYHTTPTHLFRASVVLDQILSHFGERATVYGVHLEVQSWLIEATNNKYVETY